MNQTQNEQKQDKKSRKEIKHKVKLKKRQKIFLEMLELSKGIVSNACKAAKVGRTNYYEWLKNPEFQARVDEVQMGLKDFGEHALISLMKDKNPAAIIFFNKSKNKDRGYIEKTEVQHSGEVDNKLEVVFVDANEDKQELNESSSKQ